MKNNLEKANELRLELEKRLKQYDIIIEKKQDIQYGQQWKVVYNGQSATINTYHGKKGFRVVVQAKNEKLRLKLEELMDLRPIYTNGFMEGTVTPIPASIGCDESGKGDVFGPLAAAAVYLRAEDMAIVQSWGAKDSKLLSDEQIKTIAELFLAQYPRQYQQTCLSPAQYNYLYDQYRAKGENLNHLLADIHFQNIKGLYDRFQERHIIVDQFGPERLMKERVASLAENLSLLQMPQAEIHISVAMASVLARYFFVCGMTKLTEKYKLDFPKGAGLHTNKFIKEFVSQYGKQELINVGKLHFKTFDVYR